MITSSYKCHQEISGCVGNKGHPLVLFTDNQQYNNNNKDLFPCSGPFLNTMNTLLARRRGAQKNGGSEFSGFGEIFIASPWLGCKGGEKIAI